jgi:hypothetical protein
MEIKVNNKKVQMERKGPDSESNMRYFKIPLCRNFRRKMLRLVGFKWHVSVYECIFFWSKFGVWQSYIHLLIIKLACNNQLTWVDFMEWLGWVVLKHSSFYPTKIPINQARAARTHLVNVQVFLEKPCQLTWNLGDQTNVESRRKRLIKSIVSK